MMNRTIAYDPTRHALYLPCADAISLDASATRSEALLCAELSRLVYCRFERDAAVKHAVTSQLTAIGFSDCTFFDKNGLQAFLVVNPTTTLGVLAYRGSQPNEIEDALTDLKFRLQPWAGIGRVHQGFAATLGRTWRDIATAIEAHRGARMLYAGHSLGAALATLSAGLRRPDALYTFGSPRVGDATFTASMLGVIHQRYVDCCDLVCRIPDARWSYEHVSAMQYVDRHGVLHTGISDAEVRADQHYAKLAFLLQYAWRQPANVLLRSFADHAVVNYIHALRAAARASLP